MSNNMLTTAPLLRKKPNVRKLCLRALLFLLAVPTLFFLVLLIIPAPPLLSRLDYSKVIDDRYGNLLRLTLNNEQQYRLYTPLSEISPDLRHVTLLAEDHFFYWHFGVNPVALSKAIYVTYLKQQRRMGASTITMQVAKLRYHLNSKTWSGKLLQIFYALHLSLHYSKSELLEAYFNLAPYGNNIEGVGAASLVYFHKPVNRLSLAEALSLAVIPQNPTKRKPPSAAWQLARVRLAQALPEEEQVQLKPILQLPPQIYSLKQLPWLAPHFSFFVLQHFPNQKNFHTTLDLTLQTVVEQALKNYLAEKKAWHIDNGAVMLVDTRDMSVLVSVGSPSYNNPHIQGALDGTQTPRSPGSALKPFVYALALQQGLIHPATILKDAPENFSSYTPENFDQRFEGPIRAQDALIRSRNIPAIDLANRLTHPNLYQFLKSAQVPFYRPENYYGLALVLGDAEIKMSTLLRLYALLDNDGRDKPLRYLLTDAKETGVQRLTPEASWITLAMLAENLRPGQIGAAVSNTVPVAWKTGTSSAFRDAWSIGVFGPYVLGVWFGNFNNHSNPALVGREAAAPFMFQVIDRLQRFLPVWPQAEDKLNHLHIAQVTVCAGSGMLPTQACPVLSKTWFIPGVSPIEPDTIYRRVLIDVRTGLRACKKHPGDYWKTFEFWPSDLMNLFKMAGLPRLAPPPFDAECIGDSSVDTDAPKITSPRQGMRYHLTDLPEMLIPLTATTESGIKQLYWFIDQNYLGTIKPNEPLLWHARVGDFQVKVVDDQGQSAQMMVRVR